MGSRVCRWASGAAHRAGARCGEPCSPPPWYGSGRRCRRVRASSRRRLPAIVAVAAGAVAADGDASHDAGPGLDRLEVVVEDGSALVHGEAQTLLGAGLRRHGALMPGLGGAVGVDQEDVRQVLLQLL